MALQQHLPDGSLRVRWVREDGIGVEATSLSTSFLLSPEELIADWPPRRVSDLSESDLQQIIALRPQVFLLGTGSRQQFLPAAQMARLLAAGVGLECMDNGAAARTFNLLADEGRKVLVGFLLPG